MIMAEYECACVLCLRYANVAVDDGDAVDVDDDDDQGAGRPSCTPG